MTTVDELVKELDHRLSGVASAWNRSGRGLDELGSAGEIADRMVAALSRPSPWNDIIGPFYRTNQAAQLLGVSRQAVDERRRRGVLLGCRTADGYWVFPAIQFDDRGHVRPGAAELVGRLANADADGWTQAAWTATPLDRLDGLSPVEYAQQEGGVNESLAAAVDDQIQRWAGSGSRPTTTSPVR